MQPNLGAITYERKAVQTGWIRFLDDGCGLDIMPVRQITV